MSGTGAGQARTSHGTCFPLSQLVDSRARGDLCALWELANFDFYVVIDHSSTCWFTLADQVQPPEKPAAEVSTWRRLIVHRSLQQLNFFRCSVGSVLLVQESPHLEPISFLRMVSKLVRRLPRLWPRHFTVAPTSPTRSAGPCAQIPPGPFCISRKP